MFGVGRDYTILDEELREVAMMDDIRCIPSPRALYSESGRYNCRFTETLQTLDVSPDCAEEGLSLIHI